MSHKIAFRLLAVLAALLIVVQPSFAQIQALPLQQANCQTFPETGKQACGKFLDYWKSHGGLAQQGYPLTTEFQEKNATDGQIYNVQYFERAVFESHPENQAPYDLLLSLLGNFLYQQKYPT